MPRDGSSISFSSWHIPGRLNNPTPLHFDDNNFGCTVLWSVELDEEGSLVGGSHVICGMDGLECVVVRDSPAGVVYVGDYRRVLHANAATRGGRRLIVTAYCSESLVDLVGDK